MTQTVAQRVSRNGGTQGTFAMTYTSCKEYTSGSTNSCAPSLDETRFPISHSFPYRRVLQRDKQRVGWVRVYGGYADGKTQRVARTIACSSKLTHHPYRGRQKDPEIIVYPR
jgi:hypothetical protein